MPPTGLVDEILRKTVHLTSVIIVLIYAYTSKQVVLTFLITYFVIILVIEHFRLEHDMKIPLLNFLFREKEKSHLAGHVFFTIGVIISISVFSEMIACAAILMTTFGDMSAALIGKAFGSTRIYNGKSLEGCAAEFIVDLFIGYVFLGNWFIALIMALTATVVETAVVKIDDNLAIPVFSGFIGQGALILMSLV
ncbi:MAG TPA: CTP--2,3-di-O-geranylgeranyl-sn-glycero-1-phosphate cytidyltransferase [Methanosarcinaceae archaeon]|nr:CTP--2,3-di-O-geranylgeranyl-sn-glycero-1-phosphate cytidyltransferase [Methanosarcinaceae archaeon]